MLKYKKEAISFLRLHGLILYLFPQALWYGLAYLKFGEEPFQEFIVDLQTRTVGKGDPFYYYLLSLSLNFLPYLLLLFLKAQSLLKINHHDLFLYFISFFIPLLILSFTSTFFSSILSLLYFLLKSCLIFILKGLFFMLLFFLFILNLLACSLIYVLQITSLRTKIISLQKSILYQEKLCFFDESVYLFSLLCERKIPKCKKRFRLSFCYNGNTLRRKRLSNKINFKGPL